MESTRIRQQFLDFFFEKQHQIVPSAPVVNKDDPTLLFANSGMNQFKDIFTGNKPAFAPRVADTQKCLRVSGKHNDLEDVGFDTYHHTFFEMLGNWSFGDYFKKEAIAWSWELLTEVFKIPKDRLYVTVFEGSPTENLPYDKEAYDYWKQWIAEDRIIAGNKKDNFWEMGDTGPCGPCSEIHVDTRSDAERKQVDGKALVNADHPQVIEIWNNVFMQFTRKADGSLEPLRMQSVDTGMGFERLCMVLQGKRSTYDTDVFTPLISWLERKSGIAYKGTLEGMTDVAIRVIADHIRAVSFAIADGQLPGNTGAGYVIRRILRRASRFGFQYLGLHEPFLHHLVHVLVGYFQGVFPELTNQEAFVTRVILEEEKSFIQKLERGTQLFEEWQNKNKSLKQVPGDLAFELFDTYGFPLDLTELIAREKKLAVDTAGFAQRMTEQRERSKAAGKVQTGDWIELQGGFASTHFVGYDLLQCDTEIVKFRTVKTAKGEQHHLVLTRTPFYAESGGQVGDTGSLSNGKEVLEVVDTQKENDLIVHLVKKLPTSPEGEWKAEVKASRRHTIMANHSATHLLHAALRSVLGKHVEQRGSLVSEEVLRFDFSHFQKMTDEELAKVEAIVNEKIAAGIAKTELRDVPIAQAKQLGAMALFGEKYGEQVRVIQFDPQFSTELCGGTHVANTLAIRYFKILSESSISAGIRRIEAVSEGGALAYLETQNDTVSRLKALLKHPQNLEKTITDLAEQNRQLTQRLEKARGEQLAVLRQQLASKTKAVNGVQLLAEQVQVETADELKQLSYELRKTLQNAAIVLGAVVNDKPLISVMLTEDLVATGKWDATKLIRELAAEIQGGGGGQPFYATAGGKNAAGLSKALAKAEGLFLN